MSQFFKFYFTSSMLNMFRTLIHPSSGACDIFIASPHRLRVLISTCVVVSVWLVGVVSVWKVESHMVGHWASPTLDNSKHKAQSNRPPPPRGLVCLYLLKGNVIMKFKWDLLSLQGRQDLLSAVRVDERDQGSTVDRLCESTVIWNEARSYAFIDDTVIET